MDKERVNFLIGSCMSNLIELYKEVGLQDTPYIVMESEVCSKITKLHEACEQFVVNPEGCKQDPCPDCDLVGGTDGA